MFTFLVRDQLRDEIKKATIQSPSIGDRLNEMSINPMAKAIKTDIPVIGEFYVNAGRYCILFNVDLDNEKIDIRSLVQDVLLDKVLKDKISIPKKMLEMAE
jgi:hypothetical protein